MTVDLVNKVQFVLHKLLVKKIHTFIILSNLMYVDESSRHNLKLFVSQCRVLYYFAMYYYFQIQLFIFILENAGSRISSTVINKFHLFWNSLSMTQHLFCTFVKWQLHLVCVWQIDSSANSRYCQIAFLSLF